MKIHQKLPIKAFQTKLKEILKRLFTMIKLTSFQKYGDGSTYQNKSMQPIIEAEQKTKLI